MRIINIILTTLLIMLLGQPIGVKAQSVEIEITEPFSTQYLSDYDHSVRLTPLNGTRIENLRLQWNLTLNVGAADYTISCTAQDFTPIPLFATKTLRVIDFINQSKTTHNLPTALIQRILIDGILPEGSYVFCVVAFRDTQQVSNAPCAYSQVTYSKPPVLNETICEQGSIAALPYLFNWRNEGGNLRQLRLEYVFYIAKQDANTDIQETMKRAIENQTAFVKTGLKRESYTLKTTDFPLVAGETYVWMVQLRLSDSDYQPLFVENEGKSEVCSFVFAPPKPTATKIMGELNSEGNRYDPDYLFVEYYANVSELRKDSLRRKYRVDSFDVFKNINLQWEGWHISQDAEALLDTLKRNEQLQFIKYAGFNYWGSLSGASSASNESIQESPNVLLPQKEFCIEDTVKIGFLDGFNKKNGKFIYHDIIKKAPNLATAKHGDDVYQNFENKINKMKLTNKVLPHHFNVCADKHNLDYRSVLRGIDTCIAYKITIINMSLVFIDVTLDTSTIDTFKIKFLNKAIEYKDNIIFICAAGNEKINLDDSPMIYPACWSTKHKNLISVAAVSGDTIADSSNYGKNRVTIADSSNYGKNRVTIAGPSLCCGIYTSYSTPVITAVVAALVLMHQSNATNIKEALAKAAKQLHSKEQTQMGHIPK
jgi:Subtilase family